MERGIGDQGRRKLAEEGEDFRNSLIKQGVSFWAQESSNGHFVTLRVSSARFSLMQN